MDFKHSSASRLWWLQVYDRDGHEKGEFKRGDMYLRDLKNTKGHTSGLTGGQWHPTDRHTAMTCSTDGTVRRRSFARPLCCASARTQLQPSWFPSFHPFSVSTI